MTLGGLLDELMRLPDEYRERTVLGFDSGTGYYLDVHSPRVSDEEDVEHGLEVEQPVVLICVSG